MTPGPDPQAQAVARLDALAASLRARTETQAIAGRADPVVFGDFGPSGDFAEHAQPYRICLNHPGISWYGTAPCWVCEPLSAS